MIAPPASSNAPSTTMRLLKSYHHHQWILVPWVITNTPKHNRSRHPMSKIRTAVLILGLTCLSLINAWGYLCTEFQKGVAHPVGLDAAAVYSATPSSKGPIHEVTHQAGTRGTGQGQQVEIYVTYAFEYAGEKALIRRNMMTIFITFIFYFGSFLLPSRRKIEPIPKGSIV